MLWLPHLNPETRLELLAGTTPQHLGRGIGSKQAGRQHKLEGEKLRDRRDGGGETYTPTVEERHKLVGRPLPLASARAMLLVIGGMYGYNSMAEGCGREPHAHRRPLVEVHRGPAAPGHWWSSQWNLSGIGIG